jgi:energy-coupling factor transporter ATP-binding protein EcfA2
MNEIEGFEGFSDIINKISEQKDNNFKFDNKSYFLFKANEKVYLVSSESKKIINLKETEHIPKIEIDELEMIQNQIDKKEVSKELLGLFKDHFELTYENDYHLLVAWTIYSKMFNCFNVAPYLMLLGPQGSGKTTISILILKIINSEFEPVATPSIASIFREIGKYRSAYFIDEFDRLLEKNKNIMESLCNAGYKKGIGVSRVGGKDFSKIERHNSFCPKLFTVNSTEKIDSTLLERCLVILLQPQEPKKQLNDDIDKYIKQLNPKLYSLILSLEKEIFEPIEINNVFWSPRQKEISKPILQIAKALGTYEQVFDSLNNIFDDSLDAKFNSKEYELLLALANDLRGFKEKTYYIKEIQDLIENNILSKEKIGHMIKNLGLHKNKKRDKGVKYILNYGMVIKSAKIHGFYELMEPNIVSDT